MKLTLLLAVLLEVALVTGSAAQSPTHPNPPKTPAHKAVPQKAAPGPSVAGTYTCPTVTVDSAGRITAIQNGVCPAEKPAREMMRADRHFYFNCETGSNDNPGTAEQPFADPAHAYRVDQRTLDHAGQFTTWVHQQGNCAPKSAPDTLTNVQAAWVFVGPLTGAQGVGSFQIVGEDAATVITGPAEGYVFSLHRDAAFTTSHLHCVPGKGGGCWLSDNSPMTIENASGATNGANSLIDAAGPRATVVARSLTLVKQGAPMNLVVVMEDGAWGNVLGTWTMSGMPEFNAFVQADLAGFIDLTGFGVTGNAIGGRANAVSNGVVFTNTKGEKSLPGSKKGVVGTNALLE